MNKIFNYAGVMVVLFIIALTACKKDTQHAVDSTIAEAKPTGPTDNTLINLSPFSNAVVTFEWEAAKTGNYTQPFYEVEFDKETGDFSKPVYKGIPNKGGVERKLVLTHRTLNRIANLAGIAELSKGKVKWRIRAYTGVVSSISQSGTIELSRPEGTTDIPAELYLTGSATEGGTDLSKAVKFKKTGDGIFEIYTALNAGTYKMVDKISGEPLNFVLTSNIISSGTSANSPVNAKTIYRINLDFNTASAVLTEIVSVGLWFSGYNAIKADLAYDAAGVWKTSFNNAWKAESWGKDERYKFRMVEKDAAGVLTTKNWGSSKKDNNKPTPTQEDAYYFLTVVDNSQYDYTYKFAAESQNTEVQFKMQASGEYTHTVIFK